MFSSLTSWISSEFGKFVEVLKGGKVKRDFYRQTVLFIVSLFALIPMWDASQVVLYFIGVIALFGMGVHLMRRIFFPHISLDKMAERALESPVGASIIFASIVFFMCTLFFTASSLIGLN